MSSLFGRKFATRTRFIDILKEQHRRKKNEEAARQAAERGSNRFIINLLTLKFRKAVRELYP